MTPFRPVHPQALGVRNWFPLVIRPEHDVTPSVVVPALGVDQLK